MSRKAALLLTLLVLAIWVGWTGYLFEVGDFNFQQTDVRPFEVTGQFGDSYGVLASLLSALALIGALYSIHMQSENQKRQQFESNFYAILNSVKKERDAVSISITGPQISESIARKTDYHQLKQALRKDEHKFVGSEALMIQLYRIRDAVGVDGYRDRKSVAREYRKVVPSGSKLANYFRLLYHLYCMVRDSEVRNKQMYARIIRAHISNSEMCLLAYNCSIDEGRHKFRKLVEEFSVLHNIKNENLDDHEKAELRFFRRMFNESAFRFEKLKPLTY